MLLHLVPETTYGTVAYAITEEYKALEGADGGLTCVSAGKLVSSPDSIYNILTEVNRGLIEKIQVKQGPT